MGTDINDLVLIHIDEKPATYARIEDIDPDVKPGWWRVKLLILTLPMQVATWILEKSQIDGTPFTMGGTPMRLEKVVRSGNTGNERAAPTSARRTKGR